MVLDGLPGLYGLKYDSATAYGLPLYLCSYKLIGSTTFEVVDFQSAYNCILGRPFLKKFLAVALFAYLVLKVLGPHGPMTIHEIARVLSLVI